MVLVQEQSCDTGNNEGFRSETLNTRAAGVGLALELRERVSENFWMSHLGNLQFLLIAF